jgi:lipoyl synthase
MKISKKKAELNLKSRLGHDVPNCICLEAKCPNRAECFSKGQLTFLILGKNCTRHCAFCGVDKGALLPPDKAEIESIIETIQKLKLKFVVITSPTRDDLEDGGSGHYADIILAIKKQVPSVKVEVLIPDFQGSEQALKSVLDAQPDVLNHNLETVPRLYPTIRRGAYYQRSLDLLQKSTHSSVITKTGVMVGLGETKEELFAVFRDIAVIGVTILTIGQYFKPRKDAADVIKCYTSDEFEDLKREAEKIGIKTVFSGTWVRSSYMAENIFELNSHSELK